MNSHFVIIPTEEITDAAMLAFRKVKTLEKELNETISSDMQCHIRTLLLFQIQEELDDARRLYYKERADFRRWRKLYPIEDGH